MTFLAKNMTFSKKWVKKLNYFKSKIQFIIYKNKIDKYE